MVTDNTNSLWIARNKEGDLWLFSRKPHKGYEDRPVFREIWCCGTLLPFVNYSVGYEYRQACCLQLEDSMFAEITYENSPQELTLL